MVLRQSHTFLRNRGAVRADHQIQRKVLALVRRFRRNVVRDRFFLINVVTEEW